MQCKNNKTGVFPGLPALTILEMVIALTVMAIVFAAILPQFRAIRNSWDSRQAAAEMLQNGRVLTDHINQNLSKAVRITAVSDSTETNGYIEFEDNDENTLRYDIGANSYVEFGEVGSLSDLAGPVSRLQFTCYALDDFDTSITDGNSIRFVKAQTTLTNPSTMGHDETFSTYVLVRTNANPGTGSLVGWWKLDETSGTTAADSSGNGNDGTLTNMSGNEWTTGMLDSALDFDGSNDTVEDGDAEDYLNGLSAITVTLWVKSDVTNQDRDIFFARNPTGSDADLGLRYDKNGWGGGGVSVIKASIRTTSGATSIESTSNVQTTEWQHLALVWESGSALKLYIDGQLDSLTYNEGTKTGTVSDVQKFMLGCGTKNKYWDGLIDDVRIYNRALSAEEIAQLAGVLEAHYKFDDGGGGSTLLWWKLDETSGTTAADSSGSGRNGELLNMDPSTDWVTGKFDGALDFDGSNDTVEDGDAEDYLNGLSAITVALWVKSDVTNQDRGILFSRNPNSGDSDLGMRYDKNGWGGGGVRVIKGSIRTTSGPTQIESTSNVQTTEWQHLALVWESGSALKLYIDGQLDSLTYNEGAKTGTVSDVQKFMLGRGTKNKYWDGLVDDLRIYDYTLSATQIATVIAGGTPTFTASQTAIDSSSNGNDGTLGSTDESDDRDPSWVSGVVGVGSLSFDGEDDFVHTADSDSLLLLSDDYSISVWIKADPAQKQWAGIYAKTNPSGTENHWNLQFNNQVDRKIVVYHDGNNAWDTGMQLADVAGEWHKIQITRSDNTMRAYLDDVITQSGTFSYSPASEPGHLNIGVGRTASSNYVFKGQIDDLRIYDLPDEDLSSAATTMLP